jgi:hypothetical protein
MAIEPIYHGGLFRCCVQTLVDRTEPGTVGEVVNCAYGCGEKGQMVLDENGWRWLHPAEETTDGQ